MLNNQFYFQVNLKFVNHDINVTGVWEHNVTGRGVVVSVIDDGKLAFFQVSFYFQENVKYF